MSYGCLFSIEAPVLQSNWLHRSGEKKKEKMSFSLHKCVNSGKFKEDNKKSSMET